MTLAVEVIEVSAPEKSARARTHVSANTLLTQPICAIDGEGKTRWRSANNRHDYTLLAATWPDGKLKMDAPSLTFKDCMRFIFALPKDHTYVIFGGSYDMNMMLRDLPWDVQNRLLDKGKAQFDGYRIRWIERKFLSVSHFGQTRTIYDVLANFQKAFVPVCKAWNIGTPEQLEIVQRMKDRRGDFESVEDTDIESYCFIECEMLGALCRKFFDAILNTDYRPRAVYGPGALAVAAMETHKIKNYMAELPEPCNVLTHYAYFGGRFDCSALGWFSDMWQFDIKSAYPDQIRFLPCLKHARWEPVTYSDYMTSGLPEWGMIQVEWNLSETTRWTPFPHRDRKGNVFYPNKGKGWYHASEVAAAMKLHPEGITFVTGWRLVRECEHKPFDFVDSLYAWRQTLPYEQGIVVKLILNSLYGKTAQQVGTREGKKPPFQSFFWAGAITAGTRAKLLNAIRLDPDAVIGVATDSLVTMRNLDLDIGEELGQWDSKHLAEYAQISNGVYRALADKCELKKDCEEQKPCTNEAHREIERSRGFGRATLEWSKVRRDFKNSRGCGQHDFIAKSRFITMREARHRIDRANVMCTWVQQTRKISFWPARRFPDVWDSAGPTMTLVPYEPLDTFESQPFRLKADAADVLALREKWNAYEWKDYA